MNRTLEMAFDAAKSFPEAQQETLGRELLRAVEEIQIDARIAEAEAKGGERDANEVFDSVIAGLKSRQASA